MFCGEDSQVLPFLKVLSHVTVISAAVVGHLSVQSLCIAQ